MTATLSEEYIKKLKEAVNAEVVSINDFPKCRNNQFAKSLRTRCKEAVIVTDETINAKPY
jgi:CRISPR/Cas system-associated endonuclease/helicase Cas3